MENLNDIVQFLIHETYKALKEKTGRTPGFSKVILVIKLIVLNNYKGCLNQLLETQYPEVLQDDNIS